MNGDVEIRISNSDWRIILDTMAEEAKNDPKVRELFGSIVGTLIEQRHPVVVATDKARGE